MNRKYSNNVLNYDLFFQNVTGRNEKLGIAITIKTYILAQNSSENIKKKKKKMMNRNNIDDSLKA